ncbi:hypothetical protein NMYAN_260007 [Nitrosomonas nitrosa]|uniref:Uncharacterized protein n=1 Tax=Nitrosomonas nitrosa TaxID=52442 RepID=A0A8H8Z135_9PROT|nr:hypothetical protein NMYAN_260007 [Nitrosomonas nitrosa]
MRSEPLAKMVLYYSTHLAVSLMYPHQKMCTVYAPGHAPTNRSRQISDK